MKDKIRGVWDDPEYDSLRKDKKRIPGVTEEEVRVCNVVVAKQMLERFRWLEWMKGVIDKKGEEV